MMFLCIQPKFKIYLEHKNVYSVPFITIIINPPPPNADYLFYFPFFVLVKASRVTQEGQSNGEKLRSYYDKQIYYTSLIFSR